MNKKLIRLTESDLHQIVKESVKRLLREKNDIYPYYDHDDYPLGTGPEVHKDTPEEDIYVGKVIKLPLSSVPGIDDNGYNVQLMFTVERLNKMENGNYMVMVKAKKDVSKDFLKHNQYHDFIVPDEFGNRPCYGGAYGKTVGIALKKAIKVAISKMQDSIKHPYEPEAPWELRMP